MLYGEVFCAQPHTHIELKKGGKKSYLHVLQAYSISAGNNMKPTPTDSRLTEK